MPSNYCADLKEGSFFIWNRDGTVCRVTHFRDQGLDVHYEYVYCPKGEHRVGSRGYTTMPQDVTKLPDDWEPPTRSTSKRGLEKRRMIHHLQRKIAERNQATELIDESTPRGLAELAIDREAVRIMQCMIDDLRANKHRG